MKRIMIILAALIALTACNQAPQTEANSSSDETSAQFQLGTHYEKVDNAATPNDEVRLYFSYNCSHCRNFDPVFAQMQQVLENDAPGLAIEHTHVAFVGQNGDDMTWARSMGKILQVEEQTSPLIFAAIHEDRRQLSRDDVRQIFLSVGVEAQAFDAAATSFVVQGLQAQQLQQAQDAKLRGVPTVYVNGHYKLIHSSVTSPAQLAELAQYVAALD